MDIIHIMLQMEVDVFARLRYLQGAPMTDLPRRQFDRQAVRRSGGQADWCAVRKVGIGRIVADKQRRNLSVADPVADK